MLKTLSEKIKPQHTALLVIDVQNDTCHERGYVASNGSDVTAKQEMVPRLIDIMQRARQVGAMVIFVRHTNGKDTDSEVFQERNLRMYPARKAAICVDSTWGADYYLIKPEPGDIEVTKHRYSAFFESDLDLVLRSRQIKTLVITGVSANICVEATAKDGFMRGYYVIVPHDCTASQTPKVHKAALESIAFLSGVVVNSEEVFTAWNG